MDPEFFLQTFLGLVINEAWNFTVDKIKKIYKEHRDTPEKQKNIPVTYVYSFNRCFLFVYRSKS